MVIAEYRLQGRVAATGKRFASRIIMVARVREGLISWSRNYSNPLDSVIAFDMVDDLGNACELAVVLAGDGTAQVTVSGITTPDPGTATELGLTDLHLLDLPHHGVWVIDAEGRTAFVNQRMAELLDQSLDELAARPLLAELHHADR